MYELPHPSPLQRRITRTKGHRDASGQQTKIHSSFAYGNLTHFSTGTKIMYYSTRKTIKISKRNFPARIFLGIPKAFATGVRKEGLPYRRTITRRDV